MTRNSLILALFATVLVSAPASAIEAMTVSQATQLATDLSQVVSLDVINWKVGDSAEYKVSMSGFALGSMTKSVTKDEGSALWLKQDANMMNQKDVSEMLLSKADGKILKFIHNGKEEAIPDEKMEIISQDYVDVTVPAGTFKALHVVAKTAQADGLEFWANPRDTVMDGMLKAVVPQMGMKISMELMKFNRAP